MAPVYRETGEGAKTVVLFVYRATRTHLAPFDGTDRHRSAHILYFYCIFLGGTAGTILTLLLRYGTTHTSRKVLCQLLHEVMMTFIMSCCIFCFIPMKKIHALGWR